MDGGVGTVLGIVVEVPQREMQDGEARLVLAWDGVVGIGEVIRTHRLRGRVGAEVGEEIRVVTGMEIGVFLLPEEIPRLLEGVGVIEEAGLKGVIGALGRVRAPHRGEDVMTKVLFCVSLLLFLLRTF